jgi:hypothetical protein
VLAGLAPHLPPGLLAQALAAAAISDFSRGRALAGLAPHLPPGLLTQALAATPKTSPQTLTAILERGRSVLRRDADVAYVDLLRGGLTGTGRTVCCEVIGTAAPAIAEIAGVRAIEECVNAVVDVHSWWP